MVADSDNKTLPTLRKPGKRAIVNLQQFSGIFEERKPLRRQLDMPRRALDQPAAEPFLQSLQLQTDGGLRRPHRFRRTRKAAELRNVNKSLDGIKIERTLNHFQFLSLKLELIDFQYNR